MLPFDRSDPASLPAMLSTLSDRLARGERSVLVHVQGTRSTQCRVPPVTRVSDVFVDLALTADVPIVPVRFTGGLPVEGDVRFDFPVGHARHDLWIGRPLLASELRALTPRERSRVVQAEIRALGPPWELENPGVARPDVEAEVAEAVGRGVAAPFAAVRSALLGRRDLHPVARQTLEGATGEVDGPEGVWLEALRALLNGPG